jgi:Flp pilus assembly pilin Flp
MIQLRRLAEDETGVTAIEYGVIGAAISIMLVAVLPLLSTPFRTLLDNLNAALIEANGW